MSDNAHTWCIVLYNRILLGFRMSSESIKAVNRQHWMHIAHGRTTQQTASKPIYYNT